MKDISPLLLFVIATWATWVVAPGLAQAGSGVLRQRRGRSQLRQWPGYDRNQQRPEQRVR